MEQKIKVTISDQQIKGTILDTLRINARVLAALGSSGSGMNGAFTDITYTPHSPTLNIAAINSDKVKWTVNTGAGESIEYLGTSTAGTLKLLWISLAHPSTVTFKSKTLGQSGIFQTGLMVGVTEIQYTRTLSADYLFMCECLGGNQWLLTEVGGLANTAIGWQNALLNYVEIETGKSLVEDTEIAKIHSQNTDFFLDQGGIYEIAADEIASFKDVAHTQGFDVTLAKETLNEVSAAEIRDVVDFANIATPPTAYQIPVVQDVAGVKSLKYSADFVFENGTLKVKGAGNTTEKTFVLKNLAGKENVTVLDSGNVGIGVNNPLSKLHLNGGVGSLSTGLTFGDGDSGIYENSDDVLYVYTANTLKMIISNANVQFGIEILPTSDNTKSFGNATRRWSKFYSKNITDDGSNVGIATTTPEKSLEVSHATGDCFRLSYDKSNNYKADFTLDSAGKLTIAAAGNVEFTGDVNLTGVLKIDGVQVVKEQQAAIADLKDDYTEDDEEMLGLDAGNITVINAISSKINDVLALARTHGLIASA